MIDINNIVSSTNTSNTLTVGTPGTDSFAKSSVIDVSVEAFNGVPVTQLLFEMELTLGAGLTADPTAYSDNARLTFRMANATTGTSPKGRPTNPIWIGNDIYFKSLAIAKANGLSKISWTSTVTEFFHELGDLTMEMYALDGANDTEISDITLIDAVTAKITAVKGSGKKVLIPELRKIQLNS